MMPVDITYSNTTSSSDILTSYITTFVTGFQSDEFIQSTLEFTVQPGIPILQFNIMCMITGLDSNTTMIHVNSACKFTHVMLRCIYSMIYEFGTVPFPPTNFIIGEEYHDTNETIVSLVWTPPQGSGPEFIVDNYSISISPVPPYQPVLNTVFSPPWNVTLLHNQEYTANITAHNCAGESTAVFLLIPEYSKISMQ